jgi:hypothetical protein
MSMDHDLHLHVCSCDAMPLSCQEEFMVLAAASTLPAGCPTSGPLLSSSSTCFSAAEGAATVGNQ